MNPLLLKVRCNNFYPSSTIIISSVATSVVISACVRFASEDGILHNLSEYIAMSRADTLSTMDPDTVRAAISQKLGVVVSHTQLEELFTMLP